MYLPDYMKRIAEATTAEAAADAILANAARTAQGLFCYGDSERLSIVSLAVQRAAALYAPWSEDHGGNAAKPWRQWLKEWGYLETPEGD